MEYRVPEKMSSFAFFKMVGELNELIYLYRPDQILLDFSYTKRIDATAIPNLLFLGEYLKQKTGNVPIIRLGEDIAAGYLKKYLAGIGFYRISDEFYEYENERYGGFQGRDMDPKNATVYFLRSEKLENARRIIYYELSGFLEKYLKKFQIENLWNFDESFFDKTFASENQKINLIAYFMEGIVQNSFEFGKSDVIITLQANYLDKKVYLSASDIGSGCRQSFAQNWIKHYDEYDGKSQYNILNREPKDELEGIVCGIYKRKYNSKIYGFYNMIRNVSSISGSVMRIHSNNIRLILTPNFKETFEKEELLKDSRLSKYNIIKTSQFPGTHIEIELPLDGKGDN